MKGHGKRTTVYGTSIYKTGETKLMHKRTMVNEIAGHEFFAPRGDHEWFDLQKPKGANLLFGGINMKTGKEDRVYQMTA